MNRRAVLALLLLVVLLSATGCWSRVEVNDLAIVTMMAIDRTEEGELAIWLHVAIPGHAGAAPAAVGGGGGSEGPPFVTLYASARTVMEAAKQIQQRTPRRLFWAHMRVILIGERLAKSGLRPAVDFLTRHRELRLTNYILVARGDLGKLMTSLVDLEKLPVEYLREISRSQIITAIRMDEFTRMLVSPGADPVMGVAELIPPAQGVAQQNPTLGVTGTALFQEDKLVGYLDEMETHGLLILRGQSHRGAVTVDAPGASGSITVEWRTVHVKRRAALENGRITIHVETKVDDDVGDSQSNLDLSDPKVIAAVEGQVAEAMQRQVEDVLAKVRALNVDAAGFGDIVHQQLPGVWRQVEKRWLRTEAVRANVVIEVDVNIARTGLSSKPRSFPAEETQEAGE